MSGHTPGPWRIAGKGTIRAGDGWIASIHWRNREANARLIAAAPDMLKALQQVEHHADDAAGFMVDVKAAIANAEGREG